MTVRTRFAPSPTGYLHIGGVRTALFNWLFARQHGGQFLLRIDDTDAQRNVAEALQPILDGFRWLGIDWDEGPEVGGPYGPYFQSQRLDRYQAAVQKLLAKGLAYRDFATPDELKAEREQAEREKRAFLYSRRWMAETDEQAAQFAAEGRSQVVRLKIPREGKCVFEDQIRGTCEFDWDKEQDHVIQRADGSCLYHLASVVDDADFKITHVIRAVEHLSNTPRQIFIAQGLDYELPVYAHLPYVAEPGSSQKLSKRKIAQYLKNAEFKRLYDHGVEIVQRTGREVSAETFNPVIVDFYRDVGYLPDAIVNYLMLLGWSLDDKTEDLTREQMIQHFTLERVTKAPASFDPKKLWAFEDRYMQRLPSEKKLERVLPFLQGAELLGNAITPEVRKKLLRVLDLIGDRLKVAGDILKYADFFFVGAASLKYDEADFNKRLSSNPLAFSILKESRQRYSSLVRFAREQIKQASYTAIDRTLTAQLKTINSRLDRDELMQKIEGLELPIDTDPELITEDIAQVRGLKKSDYVHPLRVAISGRSVGPGLWESMELLGKPEVIRRIDRAIAELQPLEDKSIVQRLDSQLEGIPVTVAPDAIASKEDFNEPILLFAGAFKVGDGVTFSNVEGKIELQWLPRPDVRVEWLTDELASISQNFQKVQVDSLALSFDGLVASAKFSSSAGGKIRLLASGPVVSCSPDLLHIVRFQLINMPRFRGTVVRSSTKGAVWAGRLEAQIDNCRLIVDCLPELGKRIEQARESGSWIMTHSASIVPIDEEGMSSESASQIINATRVFFSFARGAWVTPAMVEGFAANGERRWVDWTIRTCERNRYVRSWAPLHELSWFESAFAGFWKAYRDEVKRKVIDDTLYWYLNANVSTSPLEAGVILATLGCMSIAKAIVGHRLLSRPSNDWNIIDKALVQCYAGTGHMHDSSVMSPEFAFSMRDKILHGQLEYGDSQTDFLYDVWQNVQSWTERMVLWYIGYNGKYVDRLNPGEFGARSVDVPWKESVSQRSIGPV